LRAWLRSEIQEQHPVQGQLRAGRGAEHDVRARNFGCGVRRLRHDRYRDRREERLVQRLAEYPAALWRACFHRKYEAHADPVAAVRRIGLVGLAGAMAATVVIVLS